MAKSSIKRKDKTEGRKPGQNSMNPDRDKSALKGVAKPEVIKVVYLFGYTLHSYYYLKVFTT